MKMNGKQALLVQLARRGLLLTALFSMVLGLANISRAQSSATPASPEAIPARSLTKDVRGASSTSAPITEVGDGQKAKADGIKVHGHWKIDVRDPDGKLVSQTEFENALTTNDPNAASGDFALAALLSSVNTFVLVLANGLNNTNVTSGGSYSTVLNALTPAGQPIPTSLSVTAPYFAIGVDTAPVLTTNKLVNTLANGPFNGSGGLISTTQSLSANGNQIVLNGSFVATTTATISQVGTFLTPISVRLNAVGTPPNVTYSVNTLSSGFASYSFTSATLSTAPGCVPTQQVPCAVQVSPNQSVSISVTISFS